MYLNVFVPGLQYEQGIVRFFRRHGGQPVPSAALMSPMTRSFVAALNDFVARYGIPVVQFSPGQRKDAVMAEQSIYGTLAVRRGSYFPFRQAEFSLTQVLDRPVHGRLFFEQAIREYVDFGRPEEIKLIFNRRISRRTPARFCTRVVTQDVTPSLNVYYKNARIKQ